MEIKQLVEAAFEASKNAYVPYSNFRVGTIAYMKDGTMFKGCNIENAAYGDTMCAERNAVFQAYCNGYTKEDFESLTIVAKCTPIASPCGSCRQVLSELLLSKTPIYLANENDVIVTNMEELLPGAFTKESLNV